MALGGMCCCGLVALPALCWIKHRAGYHPINARSNVLGCVMTARVQAPAAPGPPEDYAARFDDLFSHLGQRCTSVTT